MNVSKEEEETEAVLIEEEEIEVEMIEIKTEIEWGVQDLEVVDHLDLEMIDLKEVGMMIEDIMIEETEIEIEITSEIDRDHLLKDGAEEASVEVTEITMVEEADQNLVVEDSKVVVDLCKTEEILINMAAGIEMMVLETETME